jgi:5'-3' exoribonuclease 1
MGVPRFYRWLSERYPLINQACNQSNAPEFDNLYLDMNGIIHNCTNDELDPGRLRVTEEKIFLNVFKYIDKLFQLAKPKQLLFMAIDGVAPRAKMNQQRQRRFKSAAEQSVALDNARKTGEMLATDQPFDSNVITPGTEFMARLSTALKYFIRKKIKEDSAWRGIKIILSGAEVPGEGEHKIMLFIRNMKMQHGYSPHLRHVLYGLDADLIFLSLVSHEPHFALLREEVVFGGNNQNSKLPRKVLKKLDEFQFLHVSLLREYIDYEFSLVKSQFTWGYSLERLIDDWVLLAFLVGNDFLAHLPTLDIGEGGLDTLYALYKKNLPQLGGYIAEDGRINLNRLEIILKAMGTLEETVFQERLEQASKEAQRGQGGRRGKKPTEIAENELFEGEIADAINNQTFSEQEIKVSTNFASSPSPSPSPVEESDSAPFSPPTATLSSILANLPPEEQTGAVIKGRYYQDKFPEFFDKQEMNRRAPELLTLAENMPQNSAEWIRFLVSNYIEGIYWIFYYYYHGVPSWKWYYKFRYAPLASDCVKLSEIKIEFSLGQPFRPLEQLLGTLPPASKAFLPLPYRELMTSSSPIVDFYPVSFDVDMNGKRNSWEGIALIPFIDENRLLGAVNTIDKVQLTRWERLRNVRIGDEFIYEWDESVQSNYPSPLPSLPDIKQCNSKVSVWRLPKIALNPDQTDSLLSAAEDSAAFAAATAVVQHKTTDTLLDLADKDPAVVELEEKTAFSSQSLANGTFLPELPRGVVIPAVGYPFLHAISGVEPRLQRVGVNIFGSESRKDSLILSIPSENNRTETEKAAKLLIDQRCWAEWPYLRECIVLSVYDKQEKFTSQGRKLLSKAESDNFIRDQQFLKAQQLSSRAVELSGALNILVSVRLFDRMERRSDGAIKKSFSDAETVIPFSLIVQNNAREDPRWQEIAPPTIETAFPLNSTVIYIGPQHYGSFATISGHYSTAPGAQSVNLSVSAAAPEPEFSKQIVLQSKLQYYPSYMIAKTLGIHPLALAKITSSVYLEGNKQADLGIRVKFSKQGLQCPEYARRVDSWNSSGTASVNSQGNEGKKNNSSASPNYNAVSDAGGSWEYSEKCVALLVAYKKRFPLVFSVLNSAPNTFRYEEKQFSPKESAATGAEARTAVQEITDWLKTVGINNLLLIPCSSTVMAERGVKAIEAESARVSRVLGQKAPETVNLSNIPLYYCYSPNPQLPWSPTQAEIPELGDRIVSCRSDSGVPLGLKGTIVAVHQSKFAEIVFDSEFISANSLNNKISHLRGQTLPFSAFINFSRPKILVPKQQGEKEEKGRTAGAATAVASKSSTPAPQKQAVTNTTNNRSNSRNNGNSGNLSAVAAANVAPKAAPVAAPVSAYQVAAAPISAIDANSSVDNAADLLKSMLGIGSNFTQTTAPTAAQPVESSSVPQPGLEDNELDPLSRRVAIQKARKAASTAPNIQPSFLPNQAYQPYYPPVNNLNWAVPNQQFAPPPNNPAFAAPPQPQQQQQQAQSVYSQVAANNRNNPKNQPNRGSSNNSNRDENKSNTNNSNNNNNKPSGASKAQYRAKPKAAPNSSQ